MEEYIAPGGKFWKHVNKTDGCWNWTGARDRAGYGRLFVDNKSYRAHRVALLAAGLDATGAVVDHLCHNHSCVNPKHLRVATHQQNNEHRAGANKTSRTGYLGVTDRGDGRYRAVVWHARKRHDAGTYRSPEAAAEAARQLRMQLCTHNDKDR